MEKDLINSLEKELKDKANEIVEQIGNDNNILSLRGKYLINFLHFYQFFYLRKHFIWKLGDNETMVKKFLKDLSKAPAPKQLAVGTGAGWLVGYLTMKVGKAAATAVGGSLLILQVW